MRYVSGSLLLMLILVPLGALGDDAVIRLSEPVATTATHEVFGAPLDESLPAVTLTDLVGAEDRYLDQEVLVTTRIAQVCQKKGCFFVAQEGPAAARVTFKDYGFFIPTDAGGKIVTLAGTFSRAAVTTAQAEHFAEDLGSSEPGGATAGSMAGNRYVIVATSVSVPKT